MAVPKNWFLVRYATASSTLHRTRNTVEFVRKCSWRNVGSLAVKNNAVEAATLRLEKWMYLIYLCCVFRIANIVFYLIANILGTNARQTKSRQRPTPHQNIQRSDGDQKRSDRSEGVHHQHHPIHQTFRWCHQKNQRKKVLKLWRCEPRSRKAPVQVNGVRNVREKIYRNFGIELAQKTQSSYMSKMPQNL